MNEEILKKYRKYLRREYRKEATRSNYCRFVEEFLTWLKTTKGKSANQINLEDTQDFKVFCTEKYAVNGNVGRLNGLNNFVDGFLGKPKLRVTAPRSQPVNKVVLSDKELEKYVESAETPLEKLIAIYQVDGFLRPGEFPKLKISLHDLKNQILYLDDTKTGNNSVILTPRMMEAYKEYLRQRIKPKDPKNDDYLIIIDIGSNYGKPITTTRSGFIWRHTKKIAVKGGFTKSVYPYLIKPSAITEGFNKQINPKILQRQARHKKIETTLLYDHTSDKMAKEYFNRIQGKLNIDSLSSEDKAKVWLDKLLSDEIDLKTFKTGIDVLLPKRHRGDDIGYV